MARDAHIATDGRYPASVETLLDILDETVARYGDRPALSLRRDDGSSESWWLP